MRVASHGIAIKEADSAANLQSFIVFDGFCEHGEGSSPTVYFSRCPPNAGQHFAVLQAGILLTLRDFCTHFSPQSTFDYMATDTHETAVLELSSNIFMAVQRRVSSSPNRNLLLSILRSFRSIYELFFCEYRRDPVTNHLTPLAHRVIRSAFERIVDCTKWTDLAFVQLFDAFLQIPPDPLLDAFKREAQDLQGNPRNQITHLAVLHSRYFVYSSFPQDVSRTLSIAIRMKFAYLFPSPLAKQDERMYWIIGLSRPSRLGVQVYAPPIHLDGVKHPLVALRMRKWRIFIGLNNGACVTPELLQKLPAQLGALTRLFALAPSPAVVGETGAKAKSYIVLQNERPEKRLMLRHEKLADPVIPIAENTIFLAQWFATTIGPSSAVAFRAPYGFSVYFKEEPDRETVVMVKTESTEVSAAICDCTQLIPPST
jgi:hypothetical protein